MAGVSRGPAPPFVSGFLVVKDADRFGYPVLEAMRAALPACDELLVADGGSNDGTWEALQEVAAVEPRVVLWRDPWPSGRDFGSTIRIASERVRRRCRGDWCLYLQANEILHEAAVAELRGLPARFPAVDMFRLPFLSLLGRRQVYTLEFRRRLVRRRFYLQVRGDGYDLGYRPLALLLRAPLRFLRFAASRQGEMPVFLPRPVFRYRALSPDSYLRKASHRTDWLDASHSPSADAWRREAEIGRRVAGDTPAHERDDHHVEDFWRRLRVELTAAELWPRAAADAPYEEVEEKPTVLAALPERWSYSLADSLAAWRARTT